MLIFIKFGDKIDILFSMIAILVSSGYKLSATSAVVVRVVAGAKMPLIHVVDSDRKRKRRRPLLFTTFIHLYSINIVL